MLLPSGASAQALHRALDKNGETKSGRCSAASIQLRNIADVYKRPPALFYLSSPPSEPETIQDFRSYAAESRSGMSSELVYAIRNARERRDAAMELMGEAGSAPTSSLLKVSSKDDPEHIGKQLRLFLGVSLEDQLSWGIQRGLSGWKTAVENRDILVFETRKVLPTEARGFSISEDTFPVIVLNGKDTPTGRTFTLLHEMAHLSLRTGGICDTSGDDERSATDNAEQFCNRIAAATLMPRAGVEQQAEVRSKAQRPSTWADLELKRLANRFGVSREAMLLRLVDIGRATISFYRAKKSAFTARISA